MYLGFVIGFGFALFGGICIYVMSTEKIVPWSRKGGIQLLLATLFLANAYCAAVSQILFDMGGSADNGKIEGGRFYLGGYGEYTEVSEKVWRFSHWHSRIAKCVWLCWFVGIGSLVDRYVL